MSTQKEFLASKEYAKKYGLEKHKIAAACRKQALLAERRMIPHETSRIPVARWFILDIPPNEHPKWHEYNSKIRKNYFIKKGSTYDNKFDEWSVIFLERFNQARVKTEKATFTILELSKMLKTAQDIIRKWTEVGVEGYGKLPRMLLPDDKVTTTYNPGGIQFYYHQKDVIRFLKGEFKDPTVKHRSMDDTLVETDIDIIAASHGYYVFDASKVSSLNYEGFMQWVKNNIYLTDRGTRRKIKFIPNEKQLEFYRNAFTLNPDNTFKHKIICASRPRGDYKSFDVTLLFLFRFFNMPEEQIFLVANSEKQTTHLLFNEARKLIRRSPHLINTPGLEIKEKGIYLMSGKKEVYSSIEVMSVESGARSNATCFAFSEVWKLTDETNFAEIEQSVRGVDNAWVLIESTVSSKGHIFHRMYKTFLTDKDPLLYFQYYSDEHFNPKINDIYLQHVEKLYPHLYKMFFRNRWEDASTGLFDIKRIEELNIIGAHKQMGRTVDCLHLIDKIVESKNELKKYGGIANDDLREFVRKTRGDIATYTNQLITVDSIYTLPASGETLSELSKIYGCEFIIGMGLDRAKQMTKRSDRTVLVTLAKGILSADERIMFVLDIYMPEDPNLTNLINRIIHNSQLYGWVDTIHIEEYQGKDLHDWCLENGFNSELVPGSFKQQEMIFSELSISVDDGFLKCPPLDIWADEQGRLYYQSPPEGKMDLLREELSCFEYDAPADGRRAGYFGSSFKRKSNRTVIGGVKDDIVFALGHAVHAASSGDIPSSAKTSSFAGAIINTELMGDYN